MKLYRIRYKEAFVTAIPIEEVAWDPPFETTVPQTVSIMPGVPVQHCEIIAAHWAKRRVDIPAHDDEIKTVKPAWSERVPEIKPGYYKTENQFIKGHYETKEIWIPEHDEQHFVEVPGYFEERRVRGPGHYERQEIWIPGHWVTKSFWQEPRPARRLPGKWVDYEYWVAGEFRLHRVWIEGRWERKQFWVDPTYQYKTITVTGGFRDHRVWIEGHYEDVKVWVEPETVWKDVLHAEETVTTIVAVPMRTGTEDYWQEAYEKCWEIRQEDFAVAGIAMPAAEMAQVEDWFAWYQTQPFGQVYIEQCLKFGWFEKYSAKEIAVEAWRAYKHINPDINVRVFPDVVLNFRPEELKKMMSSSKGIAYLRSKGMYDMANRILKEFKAKNKTEWTTEELSALMGVAKIAALVAAFAAIVYWAWPGARYDLKVTYTEWTYVLRYQEVFQYANIVGVSPMGKPTYHAITEWGGPIISETRSYEKDLWKFGEEWEWSAWQEDGRWMGLAESRYWYEAEVEYLGMVTSSGAAFYTLHDNITVNACANHEPGWTLPSTKWDLIEEDWWHERI